MAVTAQKFTVSNVALALNTASQDGTYLTIKNTDAANLADLGPSTVTAGNGFSLGTSTTVTVFLKPGDVLYAIKSGATDVTSLTVLRT